VRVKAGSDDLWVVATASGGSTGDGGGGDRAEGSSATASSASAFVMGLGSEVFHVVVPGPAWRRWFAGGRSRLPPPPLGGAPDDDDENHRAGGGNGGDSSGGSGAAWLEQGLAPFMGLSEAQQLVLRDRLCAALAIAGEEGPAEPVEPAEPAGRAEPADAALESLSLAEAPDAGCVEKEATEAAYAPLMAS